MKLRSHLLMCMAASAQWVTGISKKAVLCFLCTIMSLGIASSETVGQVAEPPSATRFDLPLAEKIGHDRPACVNIDVSSVGMIPPRLEFKADFDSPVDGQLSFDKKRTLNFAGATIVEWKTARATLGSHIFKVEVEKPVLVKAITVTTADPQTQLRIWKCNTVE